MFDSLFKRTDSPQHQARVLLMRIKAAKHLTTNDLAEESGICAGTLTKFLGKELDVTTKTYTRILEYIWAEKGRIGL